MSKQNFRKSNALERDKKQYHVLLLESDESFSCALKRIIESRLPVSVTIVRDVEIARKVLTLNTSKFFIGITSILNLDSSEFEKVNLLGEFNVPVVAIVNYYEDKMRDQLIKHHVIDYVLKDSALHGVYICDLISRIYKNCAVQVMVVDDSMVSRFLIVRELQLQQFEVLQASDGVQALDILNQNPNIKLILVDNQMPNMDGYTLTEKIREMYSKDTLVIIGISSSSDPRITVKFLKSGANDFIAKPFNHEMLLCRVTQNLDMLDAVALARRLSNTDFLSGLYNRRYFFEQGDKLLQAVNNGDSLTVMMFDIDFFKKINDSYGHDIGDEVIKNFASLLKSHFSHDIVARVGGEEFAVISTSNQYISDFSYIEYFRQIVANQTLKLKQWNVQYTCSIGVCNVINSNLDLMMNQADKNLYRAKQAGRNQVCIDAANNLATSKAND
ncbi:MAG: diguanylate cyclase [Methylotenera sp.]|nr:diguanylate cyclase [Methylotenera sp.]